MILPDLINFIGNLSNVAPSFEEVLEAEKKFYDVLQAYWHTHNFLTLKWWFLVVLTILPPLVWWYLVDKRRLTEITSFGLFYGVSAIILDSIGSNALVWAYPIRLTPYLFPQLYPYDVGVVIIPFMLVYQRWGKDGKLFMIASLFLSLFLAFIAETAMERFGIYQEMSWKNIYSFPIYWLLGVMCWKIIKYFHKLEQQK
ncbi:hypothetical protein LCL95_01675 [Bacillus timonensis]|nr:hypothetical protein [Bacillus timonensis]